MCCRGARSQERDLKFVIEVRRCMEACPGLGDHQVEATVRERCIGAKSLPPKLAQGDIEVDEIVGVEDVALDVALVVTNAQVVHESGHR